MIRLDGPAGQAAQRDIATGLMLLDTCILAGTGGAQPSRAIEDAREALGRAVGALSTSRASYGPALIEAWRALALDGDATALPPAFRDALAVPIEGPVGWLMRAAVAAAYSVALVRAEPVARPDARMAREAFAAAITETVVGAGLHLGDAVAAWLSAMTGEAALNLSRRAATLAPIVRVETALSLPASRLAYDLYGDAGRAAELVDRNRAATPAMMPTRIEALRL